MELTKTGETIFKFNTLWAANSFIEHAIKHCWTVVLGDDELFWVVTLSYAARLQREGYELAG